MKACIHNICFIYVTNHLYKAISFIYLVSIICVLWYLIWLMPIFSYHQGILMDFLFLLQQPLCRPTSFFLFCNCLKYCIVRLSTYLLHIKVFTVTTGYYRRYWYVMEDQWIHNWFVDSIARFKRVFGSYTYGYGLLLWMIMYTMLRVHCPWSVCKLPANYVWWCCR